MRANIVLAAMALTAGTAWTQPPALTMTCHPMYKGNDLGPQVYRIEGVELVKSDPAVSRPLILSSAVKRQPLDRITDQGKVIQTAASHRVRGTIVVRTIFWTDPAGNVLKRFTETYDFAAKTIRGLTGDLQRCR